MIYLYQELLSDFQCTHQQFEIAKKWRVTPFQSHNVITVDEIFTGGRFTGWCERNGNALLQIRVTPTSSIHPTSKNGGVIYKRLTRTA